MEIDAVHGNIAPPVLRRTGEYPSQLTCEWILTGGKKIGRGMELNFNSIDLAQDPRADPKSHDSIKVRLQDTSAARSEYIPSGMCP